MTLILRYRSDDRDQTVAWRTLPNTEIDLQDPTHLYIGEPINSLGASPRGDSLKVPLDA
jgi:hypothetical protein